MLFVAGGALVVAVAIATADLTAGAFEACGRRDAPEYCEYPLANGFFTAMPLAGALSYLVGGIVGLVLLRRTPWCLAVPPTLALLACAAMVVPVAFL
ncbi:hypothetical protein Bcav_3605 [Beutenbergia cavernae DSM 12333]|uniref:Uncharacterized protein n=1 Tax=Beutenbergia cavernae (strain ATCC BAA-8 / DSM 12333 / CCUG 43141 / JCM 11478 / NBRC 16432 / NCIMB 13614 / HKI 0122) TaxID=471853 RepID=C5C303_BEUC1|nr:hypothetical protein Bcav_3605 [Beutenbergia cavernae DSM 12333]